MNFEEEEVSENEDSYEKLLSPMHYLFIYYHLLCHQGCVLFTAMIIFPGYVTRCITKSTMN